MVKWIRIRDSGPRQLKCVTCEHEFTPPKHCRCAPTVPTEPHPEAPVERVVIGDSDHPLCTVPGCVERLIELSDLTRPRGRRKPTLTEAEMRAMREHRQTLQALMAVAQFDRTADLVDRIEVLEREIGRHREKRQGHAQRSDNAVTPRVTKNRSSN